jgi:hypothetical protein
VQLLSAASDEQVAHLRQALGVDLPEEHSLLFFGDAGNGDQFAFTIVDGAVRRRKVFAWDHEDDSRTWVAPSLDKYLEWWATGRIKL